MLRKVIWSAGIAILFQALTVFGGVEWQAKIVSKEKGKETITVIHAYAQGGNVREEFVQVPKDHNPMQAEGSYWLYKSASEMIYIVNPKEKTYMELSVQNLAQMGGAVSQVVKMTVSNPVVNVTPLTAEVVSSYACDHMRISSSYDLETKIAIMKTKSHIEHVQELWATEAVQMKDLAGSFQSKSVQTGISDLDALIQKQMVSQKNMGFIIRSLTTQKTANQKGQTETTVTEMNAYDISTKTLNNDLFKIPDGYQKKDMAQTGM
jgi:hypothetical protein